MQSNLLIQGDNLQGLNYLLDNGVRGKIDLVYIDPPYATGGNFTITNGRATTISNSKNGNIAYTDTLKGIDFITRMVVRAMQDKLFYGGIVDYDFLQFDDTDVLSQHLQRAV
jgi:DNA modification methylase